MEPSHVPISRELNPEHADEAAQEPDTVRNGNVQELQVLRHAQCGSLVSFHTAAAVLTTCQLRVAISVLGVCVRSGYVRGGRRRGKIRQEAPHKQFCQLHGQFVPARVHHTAPPRLSHGVPHNNGQSTYPGHPRGAVPASTAP